MKHSQSFYFETMRREHLLMANVKLDNNLFLIEDISVINRYNIKETLMNS